MENSCCAKYSTCLFAAARFRLKLGGHPLAVAASVGCGSAHYQDASYHDFRAGGPKHNAGGLGSSLELP